MEKFEVELALGLMELVTAISPDLDCDKSDSGVLFRAADDQAQYQPNPVTITVTL